MLLHKLPGSLHLPCAFSAAMAYCQKFSDVIWPKVRGKYEELLLLRPAKQYEHATGGHYGSRLYDKLPEEREVRNVTCNMAWTHPTENTVLQQHISWATVEQFTVDFFPGYSTSPPRR